MRDVTAYTDHIECVKGRGASPSTLLASSLGSEETDKSKRAHSVVLQAVHRAAAKVGHGGSVGIQQGLLSRGCSLHQDSTISGEEP